MQESKQTNCSSSPKAKGKVCFQTERCKGCGFCVEFCPVKVLEFSKDYNKKG
ncbi:MAG: 4Fe-4S binding protein, partial [bacterium]